MISVLVADDSALVRRLVTGVLSEAAGIQVVGTAGNGEQALAKVDRLAQQPANREQRWAIVEALTANETSWFRDAAVFEGFRKELLPRLLDSRPAYQPLRGLPARHLVRYFQRAGTAWQVDPQLQRNVSFRELNLAAPFTGLPRFEVVFLRNVLEQARLGRFTAYRASSEVPLELTRRA